MAPSAPIRQNPVDPAPERHRSLDIYVARQPILNTFRHTVGYELLYRNSGTVNCFPTGEDGAAATSRVLYSVFYVIGMHEVTGGRLAFINFDKDLLVSDLPGGFPAKNVVIEILETVAVDEAVVAACKALVRRGFKLALDDFILKREVEPLLPLASIIKIDWKAYSFAQTTNLVRVLKKHRIELLAEKVESPEDFSRARELGFDYFQGFFFARPTILQVKSVPVSSWSLLKILRAIQNPELKIDEVTDIVARDPSLSYKLLKTINSAAFGLKREISSIQQAIVFLGETEIRRWLSIMVMARMSSDKPMEVLVTACTRGRFGELVATGGGRAEFSSRLFLAGLLSLLDVIIGRPLDELLPELPLDPDIQRALLQSQGPLAPYLALMTAWERADEPTIARCLEILEADQESVAQCYLEAVNWADSFYQA